LDDRPRYRDCFLSAQMAATAPSRHAPFFRALLAAPDAKVVHGGGTFPRGAARGLLGPHLSVGRAAVVYRQVRGGNPRPCMIPERRRRARQDDDSRGAAQGDWRKETDPSVELVR
jgi:hypothetical protein